MLAQLLAAPYSDFSSPPSSMPAEDGGAFVNWTSEYCDHLDEVAPRVAEAQPAARLLLDAGLLQRAAHALDVVHHEAEVAVAVGHRVVALRERQELVAHVEEGHPARPSAQLRSKMRP